MRELPIRAASGGPCGVARALLRPCGVVLVTKGSFYDGCTTVPSPRYAGASRHLRRPPPPLEDPRADLAPRLRLTEELLARTLACGLLGGCPLFAHRLLPRLRFRPLALVGDALGVALLDEDIEVGLDLLDAADVAGQGLTYGLLYIHLATPLSKV